MKSWLFLLIVIPIIAIILSLVCGLPALDWVGWLFDVIANLFGAVGKLCRWVQDMINWGIIG